MEELIIITDYVMMNMLRAVQFMIISIQSIAGALRSNLVNLC